MSVGALCGLLGLSRSWYYERRRREGREEDKDAALRAAMEEILEETPGYGYRPMTKELGRREWVVNHKRVLRVMREAGLLCRRRRRWVRTTDSDHGGRVYPNLARGMEVAGLDQLWVADITYVRLGRGFVYLAVVVDAYSRRVMGWAVSRWRDTQLVLEALWMALAARGPAAGWVHHSDRGSQYASEDYLAALEEAGAEVSMSRRGNPYDNAIAESLIGTVKVEEVYMNEYASIEEVRASIGEFIGEVYNRKRLHSSLGYLPPVEFEQKQLAKRGVLSP